MISIKRQIPTFNGRLPTICQLWAIAVRQSVRLQRGSGASRGRYSQTLSLDCGGGAGGWRCSGNERGSRYGSGLRQSSAGSQVYPQFLLWICHAKGGSPPLNVAPQYARTTHVITHIKSLKLRLHALLKFCSRLAKQTGRCGTATGGAVVLNGDGRSRHQDRRRHHSSAFRTRPLPPMLPFALRSSL